MIAVTLCEISAVPFCLFHRRLLMRFIIHIGNELAVNIPLLIWIQAIQIII